MTTIYVPQKIETAEYAASLPVGTLAAEDHGYGPDFTHVVCRVAGDSIGGGHWEDHEGWWSLDHDRMIGWTALVPVEAEEVHITARGQVELDACGCAELNPDAPDPHTYRRTEYHTPWERAQ